MIDDLLASASHLVSRAARHVGFVLCDNTAAILQRIEFVALGGSRVLVVVISRGNQITQKVVDTGEDDMFDVMKLLIQNNYKRLIMPEHPVGLAVDKALGREYGSYVGWTYNVAYCRAMMQVALRQVRGI